LDFNCFKLICLLLKIVRKFWPNIKFFIDFDLFLSFMDDFPPSYSEAMGNSNNPRRSPIPKPTKQEPRLAKYKINRVGIKDVNIVADDGSTEIRIDCPMTVIGQRATTIEAGSIIARLQTEGFTQTDFRVQWRDGSSTFFCKDTLARNYRFQHEGESLVWDAVTLSRDFDLLTENSMSRIAQFRITPFSMYEVGTVEFLEPCGAQFTRIVLVSIAFIEVLRALRD
jgi:hypothetical protein